MHCHLNRVVQQNSPFQPSGRVIEKRSSQVPGSCSNLFKLYFTTIILIIVISHITGVAIIKFYIMHYRAVIITF